MTHVLLGRVTSFCRNRLVKNVAILASGTAAAQVLTVASSPILTRIYGPEAFGLLALFTAIMLVATAISTLDYHMAVVLPEEEGDAANLVALSMLIVLGISALSFVVVALAGDWFIRLTSSPELRAWLWLLPLGVLFAGSYKVFDYWSTRNQQFRRLSGSRVLQSATTIAVQLVAALGGVFAGGLIFGQVVGQSVASAVLGRQIWTDAGHTLRAHLQFQRARQLALRYARFPKFSAPQHLVFHASQAAIPFFLAFFFSPAVVGFYALAYRILKVPANLLGKTTEQVFYPHLTGVHRQTPEKLYVVVMQATTTLAFLVAGPTLIIVVFGPQLFSLAFGADWAQAGSISRYLVVYLAISLVNQPSVVLSRILGLQHVHFLVTLARGVLVIVAIVLAALILENSTLAIAYYAGIGTLFHVCFLLYICRACALLSHSRRFSTNMNRSGDDIG